MTDQVLPPSHDGRIGTVKCPSCGTNAAYYHEDCVYFGCNGCATFFKADREKPVSLQGRMPENDPAYMTFALGAVARIDSKDYVLVGFLLKTANEEDATWREYLMYNIAGNEYLTLSEYNGHWTKVVEVSADNYEFYNAARFFTNYATEWGVHQKVPAVKYKQFTKYTFRQRAIIGSFDWDVAADDSYVSVEEYAKGSELIISEKIREELTWYKGSYMSPADVAEAFGVAISSMPNTVGMSVIQPHKVDAMLRPTLILSAILLVFIFLFNLVKEVSAPPKEIIWQYTITKDTAAWGGDAYTPVATEPFTIDSRGAVKLEVLVGSFNNEWLEVTATLVNDKTGKTYEFTKVIERYSGVEGGESWAEGANYAEGVFSSVPPGTYHINVYPFSDKTRNYDVWVTAELNTPLSSNTWWFVLIIVGYAFCIWVWHNNIHNLRWGIES